MITEAGISISSAESEKPLLFISHRPADQDVADLMREFIIDRSGGHILVAESSMLRWDEPSRQERDQALKQYLWRAGVILLIYTSPDEDCSSCMWECGVAIRPDRPETKVVVLQCGPRPPAIYDTMSLVDIRRSGEMRKFVSDLLTSPGFFPGYEQAAPAGLRADGEEVQRAARELEELLGKLVRS